MILVDWLDSVLRRIVNISAHSGKARFGPELCDTKYEEMGLTLT